MNQRENELERPWARTFEWLIPDDNYGPGDKHDKKDVKKGIKQEEEHNYDDKEYKKRSIHPQGMFSQWLDQSNSQPFWIYGKPGSGKSTLMKCLFHLSRFRERVKRWAGIRSVAFAAFYFFDRGISALQKTAEGLIRSLLHQIITQDRSTAQHIEDILPAEYSTMGKQALIWDLRTLNKALDRIMEQLALTEKLSICLFLDGLDEFGTTNTLITTAALAQMSKHEKDLYHREKRQGYKWIRNLVFKLAASSNVKICASSRDIQDFTSVSAKFPFLKLEELTRSDIRKYVMDRLRDNSNWCRASSEASAEMTKRIATIINKAHGVFLWVKLVVEQIVEALEDGAYIKEITDLIDDLPADLHQLYARMLSNVKDEWQSQGALLFALVFEGQWDEHPRSAIMLHFAETAETEEIVSNPLCKAMGSKEAWRIIDQMHARLKTRCAGLLEIYSSADINRERAGRGILEMEENLESIEEHTHVRPMHQSVKDFIDENGGLPGLFGSVYSKPAGDIILRLLRSSIIGLQVLSRPFSNEGNEEEDMAIVRYNRSFAFQAVHYASLLNEDEHYYDEVEILIDFLNEIGSVVFGTYHKQQSQSHWITTMLQEISSQEDFLSFVIESKLEDYAIRKLRHSLPLKAGRPLLECALGTLSQKFSQEPSRNYCLVVYQWLGPEPASPKLVAHLLKLGADVNEIWTSGDGATNTVWGNFLRDTPEKMMFSSEFYNRWSPLGVDQMRRRWVDNMKLLIVAGADVNCNIKISQKALNNKRGFNLRKVKCILDLMRVALEPWPKERDEIIEMLRQRGAVEYEEPVLSESCWLFDDSI